MLLKRDAGLPGKHILAALIFITQPSVQRELQKQIRAGVIINITKPTAIIFIASKGKSVVDAEKPS